MTQKELLYVEDTYNHEKLIIEVINDILSNSIDEKYTSILTKHANKHTSLSDKFIKLLKETV